MIKISPDLIFDLRHALIESRDANLEIAKYLRQQCTKGDPLAPVCPNCAASIGAHMSCADDASNFLARIQADLDRDKIERNGSPFSSRAAADLAGIHRRTVFPEGRYGENAALDEALENLHRSSLGAVGETVDGQERARDGLREFADGGKAAKAGRDNLAIEVSLQRRGGRADLLYISEDAANRLGRYIFPGLFGDGK